MPTGELHSGAAGSSGGRTKSAMKTGACGELIILPLIFPIALGPAKRFIATFHQNAATETKHGQAGSSRLHGRSPFPCAKLSLRVLQQACENGIQPREF